MRFARPGRDGGEARPTPERLDAWRLRMLSPDDEVPGSVDLSVLLARTDAVAVALLAVRGFTTGVRFTLSVRARDPLPPHLAGRLFELVSGLHGPDRPDRPDRPAVEGPLLLGVEFSDGRRASTRDARREPWSEQPVGPDDVVLFPQGGGGGELSVDQDYWISPLPPAGDLSFVFAWPAFGIGETRTTVDAGPVLAAAGRAVVLWPPSPGDVEGPTRG